MIEKWVTARHYPNYEVSSMGQVRNKKTGKLLKPSLNKPGGYLRVGLDKKHVYVHRLVADSFYDGNHAKMDVNHIDGNKLNNTLPNLEWLTRKQNINHAYIHGLKYPSTIKIVRCKFCKHRNEYRFCEGKPDEFYCADGERDE